MISELPDRKHRIDTLLRLQGKEVDHGAAARSGACPRHFIDFKPVDLARTREAQQGVVGVSYKQLVDEVLILHLRCSPPLAAPALDLVVADALGLGVAAVGQGHDDVFLGNQIFHLQAGVNLDDLRAPRVSVVIPDLGQLRPDNGNEAVRISQDFTKLADPPQQLLVLGNNLVLLKASKPLQPQIKDRLRLDH